MCGPGRRVRGMWWMHAVPIHGLHRHWCERMETVEVLNRRRMVRVLSTVMPGGVVLERFLVMVLVVHL